MRLVLNPDGGLSGLLGGYRDFRDVYAKDTFNIPSGGQSRETTYYQNQIGYFYALRRNADGLPDPKTGRIPQSPLPIASSPGRPLSWIRRRRAVIDQPSPGDKADRERELFWRGITSKAISLSCPDAAGLLRQQRQGRCRTRRCFQPGPKTSRPSLFKKPKGSARHRR